jgi:transposase
MSIVPRWSRQRIRALEQWARKRNNMRLMCRVQIVAAALRNTSASEIARVQGCARSQVYRVVQLFVEGGREALFDQRRNNGRPIVDAVYVAMVRVLVEVTPRQFGFDRATWTRELLAIVAQEHTGVRVSVRTMSRVLKRIGARRGRPKPFVRPRLSERQQRRRLKKILAIIEGLKKGEVAFYEDEVDIHLNPHIGMDWMAKGQQKTVLTPGQNQKAYIAGALNAVDGSLVWVGSWNKNSSLFIALLERLEQVYPDATTIYLFLDNYSIHDSAQTRRWLADHPRIKCVFLPPYSPDHNRIERLWQDLHANVTRNHRFPTMEALCEAVARWLNCVKWWGQGRSPVYITTPVGPKTPNQPKARAA